MVINKGLLTSPEGEMNGWQMLPNEEGTTTSLWYERIEPEVTKWPAPTARLQGAAEGR